MVIWKNQTSHRLLSQTQKKEKTDEIDSYTVALNWIQSINQCKTLGIFNYFKIKIRIHKFIQFIRQFNLCLENSVIIFLKCFFLNIKVKRHVKNSIQSLILLFNSSLNTTLMLFVRIVYDFFFIFIKFLIRDWRVYKMPTDCWAWCSIFHCIWFGWWWSYRCLYKHLCICVVLQKFIYW